MEIRYSKLSLKALQKMDKKLRMRIVSGINGLTETPPVGDIKTMAGSVNEYRLRIGKYRIIYEYISENEVRILVINDINSRGDIYKGR